MTSEIAEQRHVVIDLKSGQTRPGMARPPVLSSANAPWEGVVLEQHASGPVECVNVASPQHVLFVHLTASGPTDLQIGAERFHAIRMQPGQVGIIAAMTPVTTRTRECGDFVAITLQPAFLFCAAHEVVNPTGFEMKARVGCEDPLLRACLLALQREAQTGSPHGRLYAESVAATIAAHLVRHYSSQENAVTAGRGGLSKRQLARAIDYMQEQLGSDLSLRDVAAEVGLSPYHFARLFKESTSLTPHQYLIQCRVQRAKGLLQVADLSIGQVALQVGFCDQSHFSGHFKKVYGLTPRQFVHRAVRKRSLSAA